jgi:hypothetical protein
MEAASRVRFAVLAAPTYKWGLSLHCRFHLNSESSRAVASFQQLAAVFASKYRSGQLMADQIRLAPKQAKVQLYSHIG